MRFFVVGASGFIGSHVVRALLNRGYRISALVRSHRTPSFLSDVEVLYGDATVPGEWQKHCAFSDVVINLSGVSIMRRWTGSLKREIWESRVLATRNIVAAMRDGQVLINASAVGYYGADRGEEELTEESSPGSDFLSDLCMDWEKEALRAREKGVRVLVFRLGVVLGRGGALDRMLPLFRWGLGAVVGTGKQWFPWVHIDDVIGSILFLLNNGYYGPFNVVSPVPARQKEFAKTLGEVLNRPVFIRVPGFLLRLLYGEAASIFLGSLRVFPSRLKEVGYIFRYPLLKEALAHLV